jgi:hypothetical protein
MGRYSAPVVSAAALAADTAFAWWMGTTSGGGILRRIIVGVRHTTAATAVTDFQCKIGIARVTTAGTTPGGVITLNPTTARQGASRTVLNTTFATPPTNQTPDLAIIPFNTKSGVDWPAEGMEEYTIDNVATDGFAFINRSGIMPASHVYDLWLEIEE